MSHSHRLILWTPRVLSVLMCLFFALFALDAFSGEKTVLQALGDFTVHLLPAAVLASLVILAWRHAGVGAAVFAVAAIAYGWSAWGHLSWILAISLPLAVISALYLASWRLTRRASSAR